MYLKIKFANKTKKVLFKEELKTQESFVSFLEKLTTLNRNDFKVTFIDHENENLSINDQFDLDYFMTENAKSNFLTIDITPETNHESTVDPLQLRESWVVEGQSLADVIPAQITTQCSTSTPISAPLCLSLAKQTSEMNIQTEKVTTKEQFIETKTTEVRNSSEQTNFPEAVQIQLECKTTQTQVPTQSTPILLNLEDPQFNASQIDKSLFERIEALERSVFEKSQLKVEDTKPTLANHTTSKTKMEVKTVHLGVTCDGCHRSSFVGKRFKCLICPDYDLCEDCEDQNQHLHPMIRCSVQGDSFLMDKAQRKFSKCTKKGCPRFSGMDRFAQMCTERLSTGRINENEGVKVMTPVAVKVEVAEQPKDELRNEKKEMLRFMMPFEEERWDHILSKYGHLSLMEFCELVSRTE